MAQHKTDVQAQSVGHGNCVLKVRGELTAFAEDQLMAAYNEACGPGVRNVILDFSQLEYMSSSGIGLLVTLLIRAQRQGQRLLACGLTEHYKDIFELTRLNEAILILNTEAEALAAAAG